MNKYKKLSLNTIIIFLGTAGSKLISFIMLPFYTKHLSVSDYGVTDSINTYVSLLIGLVTMCSADAIFIYSNQENEKDKKRYFSSGLTIAFVGFCICSLAFIIAKIFFNEIGGVFVQYIWCIFFLILTSFLQNYLQNFLKGLNKLVLFSLSGVLYTLFLAILSIIFIPIYGVMGFVYSMGLSNCFSTVVILLCSKSYKFLSLKSIDFSSVKELLKYSVPLIPNSIMWWFLSASNRPIMEKYVGLDGIGLYAIANKLPSLIVVIFSIFINSLIVSLLEEYNKEGFREFYNNVFMFIFSTQIIFASFLTFFGTFLIRIITQNESYWTAWHYIPLISISVILSNSASFLGCTFSVVKKTKYYFYSSVFGAITALIGNIFLIKYFCVYGACFSVMFSNFVLAFTRLFFSSKYAKIDKLYYFLIQLILLGILSFVVIHQYKISFLIFILIIIVSVIPVINTLIRLGKKKNERKN